MPTEPTVQAAKRHQSPLDRFYESLCPGCSKPKADCMPGSGCEHSCILAAIHELLVRIDKKQRETPFDAKL